MQMTIRDVDEPLRRALQLEAAAPGLSLNRTLLTLLRHATGIEEDAGASPTPLHDLDDLAGTWSTDEADEFDQLLAEQRVVEERLWLPGS